MADVDEAEVPIPDGENKMATDIPDDCCSISMREALDAHDALMFEAGANEVSVSSLVTHAGARKYNQEDPIEAASAEMILQPNR